MATPTQYYGTGRRKSAVARVYLRAGHGRITINSLPMDRYFHRESIQLVLRQPLSVTELGDDFDVVVNVAGGGKAGQAGAVRLGIARALLVFRPELRPLLRQHGLLTRDARKVERKKYGQPGARKRFQFSKR